MFHCANMLEQLDITAEQAARLDELAALDLAMAKAFAGRAMAEEDPKVARPWRSSCG